MTVKWLKSSIPIQFGISMSGTKYGCRDQIWNQGTTEDGKLLMLRHRKKVTASIGKFYLPNKYFDR
jgi:hypothetical protein